MKIAIASDHAGYQLKQQLMAALPEHEFTDFGTYGEASMDYPDTALPASQAVADGICDKGILICGSGIGMSISANKVSGIRAALCTNTDVARLSRQHNDANVLCLAARFTAFHYALSIAKAWLDTDFEGERHQNRIDKIKKIEEDQR